MHSHRRPRGRIFFEVLCALLVGASFVGAWIQTGAWAFIGPAFVFTLFGLYWSFDMFGRREPAVAAVAVEPVAVAAVAVPDPEPMAQPAEVADIRFERFEMPAEAEPEPVFESPAMVESVVAYAPEPVAEPKPKRRAKKAKVAEAVVEQVIEPAAESEPAFYDEPAPEPHIEPLFDPQPFARQARPAFGKRPRGPGPRPLPA